MQELLVSIIVAAACSILYIHGIPAVWKYRLRKAISHLFLFFHADILAKHIAPKRKPPSPGSGCHSCSGCSGCTVQSEKTIHFSRPSRKPR